MPIIPLLGLLFVGLKLAGYIAWPWLWVLAPFWLGLMLGIVFYLGFLGFALLVHSRLR